MKLTGKCLEDFLKLPDSCQNSLIIELFDSVGIRIFSYPIANSIYFDSVIQYENRYEAMNVRLTRTEAIEKAIEKANDLYNQKK